MKTRNKKAFTVVELVIVIAIIAILAAILIPTFASLVKKANVSADTQLIRNLNTALASDSAANNNKPHPTMTDALKAAEDFGYDVGKINKSATDNEILWDSANDLFCYYDASTNKVRYIPESESKITKTLTADSCEYWCIISVEATDTSVTVDCGKEDMNWSVFLKDCSAKTINAKTGVDVGWINTVESINYVRTSTDQPSEQLVKIRSYGGEVTVNAPNDTVEHYGFATVLNCEDVKVGTFREFGTVGRLIYTDDNGKIEFGSTAVVYCYMNASGDAGQNFESASKADGAIVHTYVNHDKTPNVFKGKTVFVDDDNQVSVNDCVNHNDDYDIIYIGDDIYILCKCCGGFTRYIGNNGDYTVADNSLIPSREGEIDDTGRTFPLDPSSLNDNDCKHVLVHHDEVKADCFNDGTKEYWTCSKCPAKFLNGDGTGLFTNDDVLIIKHGHDLVGTYCNRCGHPVAFIKTVEDYTINNVDMSAVAEFLDEEGKITNPEGLVSYLDYNGNLMPVIDNILTLGYQAGPDYHFFLDTAYMFSAFSKDMLDEYGNPVFDSEKKYSIVLDQNTNSYSFVQDENGLFDESLLYSFFGNWTCDFYVSFSKDVEAKSCGLGGYYSGMAVGFLAPFDIDADVEIPLLETIIKALYSNNANAYWEYKDIATLVKDFKCGFFNLSTDNNENNTVFTVKLRMVNPIVLENNLNDDDSDDDDLSEKKFYESTVNIGGSDITINLPNYIDVAVIDYEIAAPSEENLMLMEYYSQINNGQNE